MLNARCQTWHLTLVVGIFPQGDRCRLVKRVKFHLSVGRHSEGMTLVAQVGTAWVNAALSRATWFALGRGLALLLLLTHQSWAAVICFCEPKTHSQVECAQTSSDPDAAVVTDQAGMDHQNSRHCQAPVPPETDRHCGSRPSGAAICCHSAAQAEVQAIPCSASDPAPIATHLSTVRVAASEPSAPFYVSPHPPPRSRPLYLSFSSLLI